MRIRLLGLLLAPTLLAAVGCSGDNADVSTGSNPGVTVAALDGKTFVSTGVTGHTLVPGTQVTVSFVDGAMRVNAGCNSIGGSITLTRDGVLGGADTFASTLMGCSDELAAQDAWLNSFLGGAPTLALDGDTLTMTGQDVTITLADQASPGPAVPLVGTTWTLDGLLSVADESVSSLPAGVTAPTLVLGADAQAAITTGCNTGGASYTQAGDTLSFGPMRLTRIACLDDAQPVESAVVAVLDGDVTYTLDGKLLTLTKGDRGLLYRAP